MTETFVSVVLIIVIVFAVMGLMEAVAPSLEDLSDLPLTDHARNGHLDQTWTVTRIISIMSAKKCSPMLIFVCKNEIRYFCPDPNNPSNYLGLIIGKTEQVAITGFSARMKYWMSAIARDGCIPAVLP